MGNHCCLELAAKSAQLKLREEKEDSSLYEMVQAYMIENEKLRRDTSELTHGRDKLTHQLQVSHSFTESLS